jgi:AcrR family transcriptional regulator
MTTATELFQERGYGAVSVADIAEVSGLSVGSFYRYFPNKEELLIQLLSQVFWDMYNSTRGAWNPGHAPLSNLERTTQRYLSSYWEHRGLLRCAFQVVADSERVCAMWWAMRRDLYEHMLVHLRQDQATSRMAPLDPMITMRALGGMVEEFARRAFVDEEFGRATKSQVASSSVVLARIWYRAVFGEEPDEPGVGG